MKLSKTNILSVGLAIVLIGSIKGYAGDPCDNPCGDADLSVEDVSGRLGSEVVVEVTGSTGCCIRGFSLGIGHDSSKLRFVSGEAGQFLAEHAGDDLQFQARGNEDEGYVSLYAFLDISFPITVESTPIPDNTVLAVLRYEVLSDATLGETTLVNSSRTFGSPNPVSNVYSRRPGEPPLEPSLSDGTVTILENVPPELDCPGSLVVECTDPGGAIVNYPLSVTDNVDPAPRLECLPPSGSMLPPGFHRVVCTATDVAGNSAECEFTVAVVDTSAPVITCRQSPLIVFCDLADLAAGGARVEFPLPTVSDECDEDISVTCDPPSGSLFPMGTTTVVCVASDSEGNTSNCTFSVEVVDETAPVLACPDDIVVECASVDGEIVDYPAPLITNECNGEPTLECDPPSGSLFPLGTTTVVCRATDAAGNSGVCTFDVTLRADTVAPELTCPPDLVVSSTCGPGGLGLPDTGGARVEFPLPAVTDNCAGEIEVFCDPPSGSFFPMGVTWVICMARDDDGNISNCLFTVEVVDRTPPDIECVEDLVVQCTSLDGAVVNYSPPLVSNECVGETVVVCDPPPGTLFATGTTTVRCTATDAAGNVSSCDFNVTVVCAEELRGDSNSDGWIDISDVTFTLLYLYRNGDEPPCLAAADSSANGRINVADVVFTLSYLFRNGTDHPDLLSCDL